MQQDEGEFPSPGVFKVDECVLRRCRGRCNSSVSPKDGYYCVWTQIMGDAWVLGIMLLSPFVSSFLVIWATEPVDYPYEKENP